MTHWNHRILKHEDGSYAIHEVYYDEDGKPEASTQQPTDIAADDLPLLRHVLERLIQQIDDNDILNFADIGESE